MSDHTFWFLQGAAAVALFWWAIDRLRAWMIKRDPENPNWLHNQINRGGDQEGHRP